jgi:hypothetical protein
MIDVASTHSLNLERRVSAFFGGNPFFAFMDILSATPNSHRIYASALEAKTVSRPEILRSVIRPSFMLLIHNPEDGDSNQRCMEHEEVRVHDIENEDKEES